MTDIEHTGAKHAPVYLDNAATTKMSQAAIRAALPYMDGVYANPSAVHPAGQAAAAALSDARRRIARCIGAEAREITFTSGGSESDNQAIISAALLGEREKRKHIVSTVIEHPAVLRTLDELKARDFEVTLVPVTENGAVSPEQIANAVRPDTCLVSVMYANNEIGTVQPVSEIGLLCREKGVLFHTDAVQAAGQLHIDVKGQNIDLLSLSAHKFHGPKGVGILYAKKGIALTPLIVGGAQERGVRAGTENLPAIMGTAAALEEVCQGMDSCVPRLCALRDKLIGALAQIPRSRLNGDAYKRLPGNVNFSFEEIDGEALLLLLGEKGICASAGSACASGSREPSHVLLAIGRNYETARASLRLTLSSENTEEEIEYTAAAVAQTVEYLRQSRGQSVSSGESK